MERSTNDVDSGLPAAFAIQGLGDSFQPTLNTGTAKCGIAVRVRPGTDGQSPDLSFTREGGGGNGPLGFGWQLGLPFVQRQTDKGVPTYGEDVGFGREDRFINKMKEAPHTCVNSASGVYGPVNGHGCKKIWVCWSSELELAKYTRLEKGF